MVIAAISVKRIVNRNITKERNLMDEVRWKDLGKIIAMSLVVIAVIVVITYALWPVSKMVERQVLVQSHQYIEGRKAQGAIWEANLAEVDAMLSTGQGDKDSLLAQKRAITAQLRAIRINQN